MNLSTEALEIIAAILPAIFVVPLITRRPNQIAAWVVSVLGTSAVALLTLGLLLKRLTASCPGPVPNCAPPETVVHRIPGLVSSCYSCSSEQPYGILLSLNQLALPIQAGVAALCVIISFVTTIRFVIWAKKVLSQPSAST
jgi:hypothetical protein